LVFFALTKRGVAELFDVARGGKAAIWVNQGLLEATDLSRLRAEGFELTDFANWVDPADESAIQDAVETIREHHPDMVLYIERS
jgi:histidinol dehydrogenase